MRIMQWKEWLLNLILLLFSTSSVLAQYTVNGNAARISCNEYRLTDAVNTQTGSVWNNNKIDLSQPFNFNFDIFLGSHDSPGADGIAFVLQPISTSVGTSGSGLGYQGITPSLGITIDTYQNTSDNDPAYDHIAIQLNGDLNHNTANNIAGPVTALNGNNNIEDGAWHSLRVQWDPSFNSISAYVDGILRVTVVRDLVNTVFAGNPMVYWGFTGSTGGENNYQGFKTALNPAFSFAPAQKRCINEPITFNNTTISFTTIAKFYWDFGDGSPIDSVNFNPVHTYTSANNFTVKQKVIGADGCEATNTQTILIGSKPIAGFSFTDNCELTTIAFNDTSKTTLGTINNWYWDLGNGNTAITQNTSTSYATPGDKNIKLAVKSLEGCVSDTLYKTIHIFGKPVVDFTLTDSVCLGSPTSFFSTILSSSDPITNRVWNIEGQIVANTNNTNYTFAQAGVHSVVFAATSGGGPGCFGSITKDVFVVNKPTAYFKYNTICQSSATAFTDSSYTSDGTPVNQWWWNLGGAGVSIQKNPMGTYALSGNDIIKLVVHNAKGCASDTLKQPIVINSNPVANFGYSSPVCDGLPVQFSDSSKATGGVINKWSWIYGGTVFSTAQNSNHTFTSGNQAVQLVVASAAGCVSDTVVKTFLVNSSPNVTMGLKDACKNTPVDFTALDNSGTVTQWKWVFGDGSAALTQNAQHAYTANGTYKVKLYATAANGCYADTLTKDIVIYGTNVFAGNDTIAAAGQPIQLNATGGLSYTWTPAAPLNDPNIANPVALLSATQTFTVKAFTPQGCESYDDVTVKIYNGPDIYLPNAFTPNNDGKNDILKGIPVGVKQFNYLRIFNRWGQLIFSTTDYNKGWDGTIRGQNQPGGMYIVVANAIDFKGNVIAKKQTVLLIR